MSIGQNIKNKRKEKGYTQVQLANLVNFSRSHLASIESDRYNPSLDTLTLIANALNVNVSDIIESSDESNYIDDDIRQIQRARKKMSEKEKERMMKILSSAFEDFFEDDK